MCRIPTTVAVLQDVTERYRLDAVRRDFERGAYAVRWWADTTLGTERPHLQEWVDRGW